MRPKRNKQTNHNISPRLNETRAITIRSIVFLPCALGDYIPRALLGFHVYLTDILANYAEADELHAADKAYDTGHARPAGYCPAGQRGDDRPYNAYEA